MGNLAQEELRNLKEQKLQEFNDTTPIITHEKECIPLEADIREMPTEIREKEVIYHQPVEIEKANIEIIKPKVREDIIKEEEHTYQKMTPEIYTNDPQHASQGDEFYSQDDRNKNLKASDKYINAQSQEM